VEITQHVEDLNKMAYTFTSRICLYQDHIQLSVYEIYRIGPSTRSLETTYIICGRIYCFVEGSGGTEKKVLRKTSEPIRNTIIEGWRKLHQHEIHDIYCSAVYSSNV
jgi:hypothetical protein